MSEITEIIKSRFAECSLEEYSDTLTLERFARLFSMLVETNRHINLTAIVEPEKVALLHFADCLKAAHLIPRGAKLVDVGCGGGFPTLPLAIVRPDLAITALDSTAKKLTFVEKAAKELSLNVKTLAARAEDLTSRSGGGMYREKYDVAVSRAVAELDILSELCLPFVRIGGSFIAMKGSSASLELEKARPAISKLGGGEVVIDAFSLPDAGARALITVNKSFPTPAAYPRPFAKIKKQPL